MGVIHDGYGRGIDENNPLPIKENKGYITPVDVQARLSQTIQTHSGVVIANTAQNTTATYIDCDGFDKVAITYTQSVAGTSNATFFWSNDGATNHGHEDILTTAMKSGCFEVKARYLKVGIYNGHTAPFTISAWVYLKA